MQIRGAEGMYCQGVNQFSGQITESYSWIEGNFMIAVVIVGDQDPYPRAQLLAVVDQWPGVDR